MIIDWHTIGNLRTELFQNPMYNTTKTETLRFWQTIAARYGNRPVVAFYELFNEPTRFNGTLGRIDWEDFKGYMEEIVYVIRAHGAQGIPLVAGFNWAYDLTEPAANPIDGRNSGTNRMLLEMGDQPRLMSSARASPAAAKGTTTSASPIHRRPMSW